MSIIPDYDKALRLNDLQGMTLEQLHKKILDQDHKNRALERNFIRSLTLISQVSANMVNMIGSVATVWDQEKINDWQKKQFPDGTIDGAIGHLKKEMIELEEAAYTEEGHVEAADCALLLFAYAGLRGFDLLEEVNKKMAINANREWAEQNEQGFSEHIKKEAAQ